MGGTRPPPPPRRRGAGDFPLGLGALTARGRGRRAGRNRRLTHCRRRPPRLGKTALWAAANDHRIGAVFANASGCGGAALARHPVGETLAQMAERFPHWILPVTAPPEGLDQHHLLALVAPRALHLAGARGDLWANPVGSYLALTAAAPLWPCGATPPWPAPERMWAEGDAIRRGALSWHIRPGGHDMLPHDWHGFLGVL